MGKVNKFYGMGFNLRRGSSGRLAADLSDRTFAALRRCGGRNVELALLLGWRVVRHCWSRRCRGRGRHCVARRRERVGWLKAALGGARG
jgi:hypothetical protein